MIIKTWLLTPFLLYRFVRFTHKIFKHNLFANCNKTLIKVSFASIVFSTFHFSFVSMLLTAAQTSSTLGISSCTLRRWHREGKITAFRSPSGVRLYDVSNILEPTASSPPNSLTVTSRTLPSPNPTGYIYTLVSSAKQKADLERQKQFLLNKYAQHELVSDVGSGINFKRAGLRSLLERSRRGLVKEVTFFFFFL